MIVLRNLNLSYENTKLLKDISLNLQGGKHLAIIGESGSGKSLFARALIALFSQNYHLNAEEFLINEKNPTKLKNKALQEFRSEVALIFQDAQNSFYPYLNLGDIFHIVLKTHTNLNAKERKNKAFECMQTLGLKDLELLWHSFAYQLSTGMARRIQLALALSSSPKYLICDEITTSLDKQNEEKMIVLLKELKKNLSLILITHDFRLLSLCDEVLFFEKGKAKQFKAQEFLNSQNAWLKAYREIYA
ncbi:nickel ABC transporter, ATP-binding protein [Campylobacter vulpis]|uniref:ABC transporter ATP-binding protein n=2 Tax=Campylobacter vulpis TaxID=1655500 RepID=A0A2G4R6L3_9BACT|nr:ATP-binding cassette domain-containing protein [Campylobacter vulpis]MBS4240174.1 ABC transporter ATP-binding protein [Campylobacter vulpis]MBS4252791.1 ABC transporter ATP-binding protein [Campylobacter vulpis]MBS4281015.1 ABC transporter ATP-binding protein [Campylobacter vulpis]MBS4307060.1 ABC transporter ATP-binding protein [Campylobacter vulpis]MBS4330086.1 ABC transporter ATP-binding protein [Campylobacter vulpis]